MPKIVSSYCENLPLVWFSLKYRKKTVPFSPPCSVGIYTEEQEKDPVKSPNICYREVAEAYEYIMWLETVEYWT